MEPRVPNQTMELTHDCFPKQLHMGIARMKKLEEKKQEEHQA